MKLRGTWIGALLALLGISSACDTYGYADLGEPLDLTEPCTNGSTVWVRSYCGRNAQDTEDGHLITEVLMLGGTSVGTGEPIGGCFNLSQLYYDGSSRLRAGSYEGGGGHIEAGASLLYAFTLQTSTMILQRIGSFREPIVPPERFSFDYALNAEGSQLTLTDQVSGEVREYRNLIDVVAGLDLTQPSDAYTFSNIASIPMYHSFARLLGYGGAGMTTYTTPGEFLAATSGQLRVEVDIDASFDALTTLTYTQFEEFGGFVLDGEFYTDVTGAGNGRSYGDLGFSIRNDLDDPASVVTGKHDYTDVDVTNGFGGAGCYTLMPDGYPEAQIPSEIYNTIDLSRVLPTDGNPPGTADPVCQNHVPRTLTVCPRP